jgi:hypothetical protein
MNQPMVAVLVLCINSDKNSIKPFLLAKVILEDNSFIHENIGSYISEEGA